MLYLTINSTHLLKAFIEEPKHDLDDLRLSRLDGNQIAQEIERLESLCSKISSTFSSAIDVSDERSINNFLLKQKNSYIDLISAWIERLEKQVRVISALSVSQKANIDLIGDILNSVKDYDEALYLEISNDVHSRIQQLNSSSGETQEEQNAINNQLSEIKKLIHSSLSSELNSVKNEVRSLKYSSSEREKTAKAMLTFGLIFIAIGIWTEAVVNTILIIIIVIAVGIFAAAGSGSS